MALYEMMTPQRGAGAKLARTVALVCFALVVAHAGYLATAYSDGIWVAGYYVWPYPPRFLFVAAALIARRTLAPQSAWI